ncbi:hypothetical protein M422DRAFT_52032 [Sphaerobolus stellatus SS14]|uniref:Uncharacterized protein n=1 Tax=Sphaerobolus stellatus (strain SS14) TaxID=990650 RepID=A0A0C9TVU0_SPHS4|nr:hypothetical protein M422DRAFT_52032 [Sphaerobolus stellatus SS14]
MYTTERRLKLMSPVAPNSQLRNASELLVEMWASPTSQPATFQIDHVKQFMQGIVGEDSDSIIALSLAPPYYTGASDNTITVDGLLHMLRVVTLCQLRGNFSTFDIDPHIEDMYLRKTALHFRHLGIPKTKKGYFKACVDACVQDNFMREFEIYDDLHMKHKSTGDNVIYLWGSIFFSQAPPERTDAIVTLLANVLVSKFAFYRIGTSGKTCGYSLLMMSFPQDLDDNTESPSFEVFEIIRHLDIDSIARGIAENTKRGIYALNKTTHI